MCSGVEWCGVRCGVGWGVEWSGVEWSGVAWRGLAWRGVAWLGVAWRGLAWLGVAWRGVAWLGVAWRGVAWLGVAWLGLAWRGTARHGTARHGTARHGTARHGTARHGTARHGTARHGTARHGTARHGTAWCLIRCFVVIIVFIFVGAIAPIQNSYLQCRRIWLNSIRFVVISNISATCLSAYIRTYVRTCVHAEGSGKHAHIRTYVHAHSIKHIRLVSNGMPFFFYITGYFKYLSGAAHSAACWQEIQPIKSLNVSV